MVSHFAQAAVLCEALLWSGGVYFKASTLRDAAERKSL